MRLKQLWLQGYKTFANRTLLVFDEGLTAIVGPNGSGKSNIADAIRWVLGEQSHSQMRVRRTEDMIFAGSQQRARASMAQVTLTLDNSSGWLPIDFTEVEIGRKSYRSGENEYLLNGQRVRLRDITDLLATSGLSERNYTLVGQGMIDRALSLNADERRALFEEAAGISHYKNRRAETLRRLQETHHNLERLHDIVAEIRPRLTNLKRQADRAHNYEQVAADLRHLLRQWYGYQWHAGRQALRQVRTAAQGAETAWRDAHSRVRRQQEGVEQARQRLYTLQAQLAEYEQKRELWRAQATAAQREWAITQERALSITQQLAELAEEWPDWEAQQAAAAAETAAAQRLWEEADAAWRAEQAALAALEGTFQSRQAALLAAQQQTRRAEAQWRAAQTALAQSQGQLSQLRERQQEQSAHVAPADDLAALEARRRELTQQAGDVEQQMGRLRQVRADLQQEQRARSQTLKQLRRQLDDATQHLNRLSKELVRLETQRDMLEQQRRPATLGSAGRDVMGHLAEWVQLPPQHQTALGAALAGRLKTALISDEPALWRFVADYRGPAWPALVQTALTTASMPPRPNLAGPEVLGWAVDLVSCDPAHRPLAEAILGPILLVATPQAAYAIAHRLPPGALAVAPDGFIAYPNGLIETSPPAADTWLAQEQAWRAAQAAVEARQAEISAARDQTRPLERAIQAEQTALEANQETERRELAREQQLGRQRADLLRQLEQTQQQAALWRRQQAEQAAEQTRLAQRFQEMERQIGRQQQALAEAEQALTEARSQEEALPATDWQQQLAGRQQGVAAAQALAASRLAALEGRRAVVRQAEARRRRLEERQARLAAQQSALDLTGSQQALAHAQTQLEALEATWQPLQTQAAQERRDLQAAEERLAQEQKAAHQLETAYTQARLQLTQQEARLDHLRERIHADLGLADLGYETDETAQTLLPLTEVVERLPLVESLPEGIEESIQRRRNQLQRMGPINPTAPQEYQETQTRFDFLSHQIADLTQTEEQLRRVIRELDELTSRSFAETVTRVDAVFAETFRRLFGGGSAQLVLTDPENLTISGVDIIARLPGKRAQGLGLLSGGERSLTAAALIFALLKVSPTPFCVLDEVDAMLDEANVGRFTDMLRELSAQTQFIIITHNRGTVQAANTLYGVSMGGDGVSQIISLRPETYVNGREG